MLVLGSSEGREYFVIPSGSSSSNSILKGKCVCGFVKRVGRTSQINGSGAKVRGAVLMEGYCDVGSMRFVHRLKA